MELEKIDHISDGRMTVKKKSRNKLDSHDEKAEFAKKLAEKREYDNELLTIRFHNREAGRTQGSAGVVRFSAKFHKGDSFETYELLDGCVYKLPRCVVNHLRNNCAYLVHESLPDQMASSFNGGYEVRQAYDERGLMNRQKSYTITRPKHRFAVDILDSLDAAPAVKDIILVQETYPRM